MTAGSYAWIGYHLIHAESLTPTLCLFKNMTGIPCPSCGVTRSVLLIMQGEFIQAVLMNPLGIIAVALLIILPTWMAIDLIQKKQSLLRVYTHAETFIKTNKSIYIPLIALVALNWIWNITKGL